MGSLLSVKIRCCLGLLTASRRKVRMAPPETLVNLVAPSDRHIATWIGGSVLSSLSIFKDLLVTKQEYNEFGPSVVHRKFI